MIEDQIASDVARLYEDYPYPNHGIVSSKIARMVAPALLERQRVAGGRRLRLLDAGCGTGENTLGLARAFPEVDVVGIDLNEASLDRAADLGHRKGIPAVFKRRNLMEPLTDLGEFDVLVSVGVLHHLPEPKQGLEQLRHVAAPAARFLGMLYGFFGKWELFQTRDALRLLAGDNASRAERLRLWKETRLSSERGPAHYLDRLLERLRGRHYGPPLPWYETAQHVLRRHNPATDADQLTHAHELVFTWHEVARLLHDAGWIFQRWPPRSGMPDSPEELFRGEALDRMRYKSLLEQAAIYERLVRPSRLYFLASPGG